MIPGLSPGPLSVHGRCQGFLAPTTRDFLGTCRGRSRRAPGQRLDKLAQYFPVADRIRPSRLISPPGRILMTATRRDFLRRSAMLATGLGATPLLGACATLGLPPSGVEEVTIAALQAAMQAERLSAESLVPLYVERIREIDAAGPTLRSVQELNPDAIAIARALDGERARKRRGPLHGIPVLLKDNIATADRMETTAGTLALVGARPREDATVARKLREAGTVILGKATMSEWAYFKSSPGSSGWSARSGQAKNPYALNRTPCGSSSGSAIAVAA